MNDEEPDEALEAAGGNLTEAIRREAANWTAQTKPEKVKAENAERTAAKARAAADGPDFWLAISLPDANEAEAEARRRGMIFGPDARRLAEAYFVEARRRFDALARGDDAEPLDADAFGEARKDAAEATARADRCRQRICDALRWLAAKDSEAAKLARGAIADFLNCLAADDVAAAVRDAFKAANAAARAYFTEKDGWKGGPMRKHNPKELVAAARKVLEEMGNPQLTQGYGSKTEAAFARELTRRGLYTADDSPEKPKKLLKAISDADYRIKAAKRRGKPH